MIDNYDSFTYNLVQYFEELGATVVTRRHDQLTCEQTLRGSVRSKDASTRGGRWTCFMLQTRLMNSAIVKLQ